MIRVVIFGFFFFLFVSSANKKDERFVIALLSVDGEDFKEIKKVARYLTSYYNCKIISLPPVTVPEDYYNKDSLLLPSKVLIRLRKDYADSTYFKVMALTEKPMYVNERFSLIRGLAVHGGRSCIISTYKIRREANNNQKLYRELLKKVSRHEIGHTLGLLHCLPENKCVMVSGEVDEVFINAKPRMCQNCEMVIKKYMR